jgi:hypothetical protein
MLDASAQPGPGFVPDQVQFYHIEICPLADGMLSIAVSATISPFEGELTSRELRYDRARTIDEVLAVIRNSVLIQ